MSGEYEINGSGHNLKSEHNLFLLETIHLVLEKFNKFQSDWIKKMQVLSCSCKLLTTSTIAKPTYLQTT